MPPARARPASGSSPPSSSLARPSAWFGSGGSAVVQVITRFDLDGFYAGVSDIAALRLLLRNGARIRGVRHLHSKIYLFGRKRAIVTSANLTESALVRNHEFGFVATDPVILAECGRYFDNLWNRAGDDLRPEQLDQWEHRIDRYLLAGGPPRRPRLGDEGTDVGFPKEPAVTAGWPADARQAFIKFFGEGHNRADRSMPVLAEVERSGCHWACTYPRGKRPRQVQDGALMFMGRLVKRPKDVLIYGRAVGRRHHPGRDDASPEDLEPAALEGALAALRARAPRRVRCRRSRERRLTQRSDGGPGTRLVRKYPAERRGRRRQHESPPRFQPTGGCPALA